MSLLECVVNVSEGRDPSVVAVLVAAGGPALLDVHTDPDHHRSVLTLAGPAVEEAAREVACRAVAGIDLRAHAGVHPRLGAVDVVPFAPLEGSSLADAVAARDRFARWAATELGLPCFLYGPVTAAERSLPEVRRSAFAGLAPDTGPDQPHPTAGAVAVGARPLLVAYNLWLAQPSGGEVARRVARAVRGPGVRALGLDVGRRAQVSCNLTDPFAVGPAAVFDAVAARAEREGTGIARAELVGLAPAGVLAGAPRHRWAELDLHPARTIEARLEQAGLDGGRFGSAGRGRH